MFPHCVPQVVAIVMDLLTDLQILQDLLDASSRRGVAVYTVLEARGVPHFLDMCTRLQITAVHLRVRSELCKHWKHWVLLQGGGSLIRCIQCIKFEFVKSEHSLEIRSDALLGGQKWQRCVTGFSLQLISNIIHKHYFKVVPSRCNRLSKLL